MMNKQLFSETHQWVAAAEEDNQVYVGISQHAEEALGDIVYVELPAEGKQVEANQILGAIESVKTASEILSPVTGKLVACNADLEDDPELLNQQPLQTWVYRLQVDPETFEKEAGQLMTAQDYAHYLEQS